MARATWTLVIAAVFASALARIALNPLAINHDCAMYLQAGSLLLEGRVPYIDLVDVNPPLIMYLNVIPAAVARALGTHLVPTFLVCVWLLTVVSTFVTRQILATTFQPHESLHADLVATGLAILSLALLHLNVYGQREHLFVLGLFPYLAFRFRHWEGGRSAALPTVAAGLFAGVTACIKPHFVAITLAPEIYWLVTRRTIRAVVRPEVVAFVAVGVAYAAHFLIVPAAMREAFFSTWLPFIARGYHVYDTSILRMIVSKQHLWLPPVACGLVFLVRARPGDVAWNLAKPLAVVAMTAGGSFLLQRKGWAYHAIPIAAAVCALLGLFLAQMVSNSLPNGQRASPGLTFTLPIRLAQIMLLAIVSGLALTAAALAVRGTTDRALRDLVEHRPLARAIVERSRPGDPVLFITSSVPEPYPLLTQLERRPASRFLVCFPIPMLYDGVTAPAGRPFPYRGVGGPVASPEEAAFLAQLRADIETVRPKAIFIDTQPSCEGCPKEFVIHDYLERMSFIATALSRYRYAGVVEKLALYVPNNEAVR